MNDISIDLETLSTRFDAAVMSIGAVAFDRNTGEIGERFYVEVDLDSAITNGHVSGSTLQWWLGQGEAAGRVFDENKKFTLWVALQALSAFANLHPGAKVWGNGATFDITILEQAFSRCDQTVPWKFWDIRDMRTLVEAAAERGFDKSSMPFDGVAHNALDDAAHQARVISKCWQTVTGQPECVALSDAEILKVADDNEELSGWNPFQKTASFDAKQLCIFANAILFAQADPTRCNSTGLESIKCTSSAVVG